MERTLLGTNRAMSRTQQKLRREILGKVRQAVADYMRSEGCSCCRNTSDHETNKARLGELLDVPKYADGSGYNFGKFESK